MPTRRTPPVGACSPRPTAAPPAPAPGPAEYRPPAPAQPAGRRLGRHLPGLAEYRPPAPAQPAERRLGRHLPGLANAASADTCPARPNAASAGT